MPGSSTIGVDTGGTFTDLVLLSREAGVEPHVEKLPSTPADPSRAVLEGIARLPGDDPANGAHVVHGTTVALNALLTGRQAPTALVTNTGLRDLVEIGRQDRPELYALHPVKPPGVVPRELRFEVGQRTWPDPETGAPLEVSAPSKAELARLRTAIRRSKARSIAVCLLHAYADPSIEARVAAALAPLGLPITCSAGLLREYREVERFSTAMVNASLVPLMRDYLKRLAAALPTSRLELMQSSGGTLAAAAAAEEPVRVLLSGPAGGVVGAARAAREAGFERMVGLDMGGTSTDVAFQGAGGEAGLGEIPRVAGHAIAVPSLDIHTIGCGGGSLICVDASGVLHVGPDSAGADPGPVCYGRSEQPTLTDAHVLLGHLGEESFLGGRLELDTEEVERAFARLGKQLGVKPTEAAEGALDVARAAMRRAVGVMTMQRGQDPKTLPLVGFGGAGGLHAAALAESLGMLSALVPRNPGVLSALGMATADALDDRSESLLSPLAAARPTVRRRTYARLAKDARRELREAGHAARSIELTCELDLRYAGQSFELRISDTAAGLPTERLAESFHRGHAALYGYRLDDREIELVHARVRALVRRPAPRHRAVRARPLPKAAVLGSRPAHFAGRRVACRLIDRAALAPGHRFDGPAIVQEFSGTTLVPPRRRADVTTGGHLRIG